MNTSEKTAPCPCGSVPPTAPTEGALAHAGRTAKTLPSVLLSLGIAFFPKCPFCWAAYMSMLGSIGLVRLPYLPWMLPVLLVLLAIHLVLMLRQLRERRYGPFACSILGAACILLGRSVAPLGAWLLLPGIGLLVAGSLWNNFLLPISSFINPKRTA